MASSAQKKYTDDDFQWRSQADSEKKSRSMGVWGCHRQSSLSKMHALRLFPGHCTARPTTTFHVAILSRVPGIDTDGAYS